MVNAKIYFVKVDGDRINNNGGWNSEYGKLYLSIVHPLYDNKVNVDGGLDNNMYEYIGQIDVLDEHEAFGILQNAYKSHPLNTTEKRRRSISIGDIISFPDRSVVVEDITFSELTEEQIKKLPN